MHPEILSSTPTKNFNIISVRCSVLLLSAGCILWVLFFVYVFFSEDFSVRDQDTGVITGLKMV